MRLIVLIKIDQFEFERLKKETSIISWNYFSNKNYKIQIIVLGFDVGEEQEGDQVEDNERRRVWRGGGVGQPQVEGQQDQDDLLRKLPPSGTLNAFNYHHICIDT
jgi:hypothetical protein